MVEWVSKKQQIDARESAVFMTDDRGIIIYVESGTINRTNAKVN